MKAGKGKEGELPATEPVSDIVPGHPSIEIALARLPDQRPTWNASAGRLLIDVSTVSSAGLVDADALGKAVAAAVRLITD